MALKITTLLFPLVFCLAIYSDASPRGVECIKENIIKGETDVTFDGGRGRVGSCYEFLNSMGNIVAVACKTEDGWSLMGNAKWTMGAEGRITARVSSSPPFGVLLFQQRTEEEISRLYQFGNRDELVNLAREVASGKITIPPSAKVRVVSRDGRRQLEFFTSPGEADGSEVLHGRVIFDGNSPSGIMVCAP